MTLEDFVRFLCFPRILLGIVIAEISQKNTLAPEAVISGRDK